MSSHHSRPRLGRLAVAHPFPSVLVAGVTAALARLAGASPPVTLALGVAMLGFQVSIGAWNDVADAAQDARGGRPKPIAAGLVSVTGASVLGVVGGATGLLLSALVSLPTLAVGVLGYSIGLGYDAGLKRRGLGPLCFAAALPLVPAYASIGGAGGLPPRFEVLLPIAIVAGITLAVANALADLETDRDAGVPSVAIRLGRPWSLGAIIVGQVVVVVACIGTAAITRSPPDWAMPSMAAGAVSVIAGMVGSGWSSPVGRERGWELQAVGVGLLAAGWLAAQLAGS